MSLVQPGEHVVLEPVEDPLCRRFAVAAKGERIKYRRKHFAVDAIVGAPYGAVFELKGRRLERVKESATKINVHNMETMGDQLAGLSAPAASEDSASPAAAAATTTADIRHAAEMAAAAVHAAGGGTRNDNRDLVDDNTAQALGQADVQRMKDAGASAAQIVSSLVANSATYKGKTEYAKAKYIKKKQRQYAPTFRVLPACAQTIVDTMHHKDPKKVCGLRSDSVAQLLAYGNVRANCTVLVVDGAKGLLVGAAAERMSGNGRIVNLMMGPHPNVPMLAHFNLGEAAGYPGTVGHFPFQMAPLLVDAHRRRVTHAEEEGGSGNGTGDGSCDEISDSGASSSSSASIAVAGAPAEIVGEKRKRMDNDNSSDRGGAAAPSDDEFAYENWQQSRHHMSIAHASAALGRGGADAFVSATSGKFHALQVVQTVMPLLASSACFAMFCPYIEPLREAALWLKKTNAAVDVDLVQMWVRNFQVLPGRTRPDMNMDDGTGFVLRGIKCVDDEAGASAVADAGKSADPTGQEAAHPTKKVV